MSEVKKMKRTVSSRAMQPIERALQPSGRAVQPSGRAGFVKKIKADKKLLAEALLR
jgi:hypothetical protein